MLPQNETTDITLSCLKSTVLLQPKSATVYCMAIFPAQRKIFIFFDNKNKNGTRNDKQLVSYIGIQNKDVLTSLTKQALLSALGKKQFRLMSKKYCHTCMVFLVRLTCKGFFYVDFIKHFMQYYTMRFIYFSTCRCRTLAKV